MGVSSHIERTTEQGILRLSCCENRSLVVDQVALRYRRNKTGSHVTYFTLGTVVEVAVFIEYVGTVELNILTVTPTDHRTSTFDIIQQTFGHQGIFVQVHQVRRLATKNATSPTIITSLSFHYQG